MTGPPEEAAGTIYDLGYRTYEGERLGRRQAITALYLHSLRGIFGLGRHHTSKIIPFALAALTLLPAAIYLGIAALISEATSAIEVSDFHVIRAADHYEFIQWPLALFVAAVAPEAVGRDQRDRTLSLYFSRALLRSDYVLAKVGAVTTALMLLALLPQALLFIGSTLVDDDTMGYLKDHWRDIAPIVGSAALLGLFTASVGLSIGCMTSRWPLASGAIIAYFAISFVMGSIFVEAFGDGPTRYTLLLSGFHVIRGSTFWIFGETPTRPLFGEGDGMTDQLALAGLDTGFYVLAAIVIIGLALLVLKRRYDRIPL
jgi:ABC-2 type transport system permease protein